jgi:hypothetical protein
MRPILAALASLVVVYWIPVTAKFIEGLLRSMILSFSTAENLQDVNIGLAKGIAALILWIGLILLVRKRT